MKKILICCGSGIVTSTAAANRLKEKLEARGFAGQFTTSQCQVGEVAGKIDDFDLVISTAVITQPLGKPVVLGIPFLTGINLDKTIDEIVQKLGW